MQSSALSPENRDAAIAALASGKELDVLVIGGGVVGAGCGDPGTFRRAGRDA